MREFCFKLFTGAFLAAEVNDKRLFSFSASYQVNGACKASAKLQVLTLLTRARPLG